MINCTLCVINVLNWPIKIVIDFMNNVKLYSFISGQICCTQPSEWKQYSGDSDKLYLMIICVIQNDDKNSIGYFPIMGVSDPGALDKGW